MMSAGLLNEVGVTLRESDLFHDLFEVSAANNPHKSAVNIDGVSATFEELVRAQARIANVLLDIGACYGDRVAISCAISPLAIAAAFGVMRAGCTIATISHNCDEGLFLDQLADCGATILITDRHIDAIILSRCPAIVRVVKTDDSTFSEIWSLPAQADLSHVFSPDEMHRSLDQPGAIFYSSGSTDKPKGVLVSHRNMVAAFRSVVGYLKTTCTDVVLSFTAGLSSDYGFYNIMMPLLLGAQAIVRSTLPATAEEIAFILQHEKVSALQVFPPAILRLLESEIFPPLPNLRYISSSGDVLPPKCVEMLSRHFPETQIFSNYGMTECKRIAYLPPDQLKVRPGSVGKAIPGVRTLLFDDEGMPFDGANKIGELGVVSDLVMQGYWNRPALTAVVLRKNYVDGQSLFLTGDLFEKDCEGYLYFVCRKQDLFLRSETMVNPRVIERELMSHPSVSEAVVVPVQSESEGFAPIAYIVLAGGANLSEQELKLTCARKLKSFEMPKQFIFLEAMPRTFGGKVSRSDLAKIMFETGI